MTSVLLLEDDDSVAASLVALLEARGHGVLRCRNLHEARATIPPVGYQAIICDYELPDGTGIEFLADVERSAVSLGRTWTTILWSGQNRMSEVKESGIPIGHVFLKGTIGLMKCLDVVARADL